MRYTTSPVGAIAHDNYTATTTAATKTLSVPSSTTRTVTVLIQNMDTAINLLVSFDGGTTYKAILPLATLALEVAPDLLTYKVKSASATVATECLYGREA